MAIDGRSGPHISIIIPSYNSEATIDSTLTSIDRQTYRDFEVILVDNLSSDSTVDKFNSFNFGGQVLSERDKGVADALNKGFARASGEIFCWLNSDDEYFDSRVLEAVSKVYLKRDNAAWIFGNSIFQDLTFGTERLIVAHTPALSGEMLDLNIFTGSLFFRADAWRDFGGFDTKLKLAFEYELLRHLKCLPSARIGRCLGVFNRSSTSLSSKYLDDMRSEALDLCPNYDRKPFYYYGVRVLEHLLFRKRS